MAYFGEDETIEPVQFFSIFIRLGVSFQVPGYEGIIIHCVHIIYVYVFIYILQGLVLWCMLLLVNFHAGYDIHSL